MRSGHGSFFVPVEKGVAFHLLYGFVEGGFKIDMRAVEEFLQNEGLFIHQPVVHTRQFAHRMKCAPGADGINDGSRPGYEIFDPMGLVAIDIGLGDVMIAVRPGITRLEKLV